MPQYLIRQDEVPTYSPPKHQKTVNRRLVGRQNVGSENLEVVLGLVHPGGMAEMHSHTDLEQVVYILEGKGEVRVGDDFKSECGPGDTLYFPKQTPHYLAAIGDQPLKCLVIYGPPMTSWEE
ncbi:MAG: cupin domain-containing protein [Chloroflexi bacterium]|nr:cupin domain-containing protein [Chloroflexota bacterium]